MPDINSVALSGRLTRDAELKYSANGGAIVRFSLAVNRSKRNGDGTWGEEASYFDCVYFGKGAEAVNSYLSKGRQIAVSGELRQSRWEQEGQTRSRVEVYVNNLSLLSQGGSRTQDQMGDGFPRGNAPQQSNGGYQNNNNYQNRGFQNQNSYRETSEPDTLQNGPEGFEDDNIPF